MDDEQEPEGALSVDTDASVRAGGGRRHRRARSSFRQREREVIEMRFGLRDGHPRTLDEVAKVYGITRERIRQIEARGLLKLRQPLRSQRLAGFADVQKEITTPKQKVS